MGTRDDQKVFFSSFKATLIVSLWESGYVPNAISQVKYLTVTAKLNGYIRMQCYTSRHGMLEMVFNKLRET